jgi:hypothetical protein
VARAARNLGYSHRKLNYSEPNATPLGAVLPAPPPEKRELFCRNGLKYYAWISSRRIRATFKDIEDQRQLLKKSRPNTASGKTLRRELDLAAQMAARSCHFMLWQQALAAEHRAEANRLATRESARLRKLKADYELYWPSRNKGRATIASRFLRWRLNDYRSASLPLPVTT